MLPSLILLYDHLKYMLPKNVKQPVLRIRIRDPGWRQFGSGIRDGKRSDSDKHPGSATLLKQLFVFCKIVVFFF